MGHINEMGGKRKGTSLPPVSRRGTQKVKPDTKRALLDEAVKYCIEKKVGHYAVVGVREFSSLDPRSIKTALERLQDTASSPGKAFTA